MARSYPQKDLKLLWGFAAARCSHPQCRCELLAQATSADATAVIGEVAHIVASSDSGPRSDATFPKDERDRYENLILLCPTHHRLIDKQPARHSVDVLRNWKRQHEEWVRERLTEEILSVGFSELEVVINALLTSAVPSSDDFSPLRPDEKMAKNSLTNRVRFELTMGLSKASEVRNFLQSMEPLNRDLPEKLKAGFVDQYRQLEAEGLHGDALFEAMREFASGGSHDFERRAAGLAVLAYMFEACEVFEK